MPQDGALLNAYAYLVMNSLQTNPASPSGLETPRGWGGVNIC